MAILTRILGWSIAVVLVCADGAPALTIGVQDVVGHPGDTTTVCAYMTDSGRQVSGVQMDVSWPSDCLSVAVQGADEAACVPDPSTGRDTFRSKLSGSRDAFRAILLSISDVSAIPAEDAVLFCCQFRVLSAAPGRSCPVGLTNVIASDPRGQRLALVTRAGLVTVATPPVGATSVPTPVPTSVVPPSNNNDSATGGSGGSSSCQLTDQPGAGGLLVLLGALSLVLVGRRINRV